MIKKMTGLLLAAAIAASLAMPIYATSHVAEPVPSSAAMTVSRQNPFTDVSMDADYADAVLLCYERGLMLGTALDTFAPNGEVTRAQVVTVLYRLQGSPLVTGAHFSDLRIGSGYWAAARWAVDLDITYQFDNGAFAPDNVITRKQLAQIICRYMYTINGDKLGDYRGNVCWAEATGVLLPDASGDIRMDAVATRAELAQAVYACCRMLSKVA